jgi:putative glutamine amidotransferase
MMANGQMTIFSVPETFFFLPEREKIVTFASPNLMRMDKRLARLIIVIIVITGLAFWTCHSANDPTIYVAIAKYKDTENYAAYKAWLQGVDSNIVLVDMYHIPLDSALVLLEKCSGLLMNGGADVHPGFYDQFEDTTVCEIDGHRDTLEMALLKRARDLKMPVFGICRGLQMINVFNGGTLYPDLPTRFDSTVLHRNADRNYENYHPVHLAGGSQLKEFIGLDSGTVNSVHHQGIEVLGIGLKPSAWSPDSLVEAIELEESSGHPFMIAVQWHPERLGLNHPLSGPLAVKFVDAVKTFHTAQK